MTTMTVSRANRMRRWAGCAVLASTLLSASCDAEGYSDTRAGAPVAAPEGLRAPEKTDDGWEVSSPAKLGANEALLDSMVNSVRAGDYVNIHSILVVKDGALALEEYFDGHTRNTRHEIRSATKSIGSILVGMAIDKGYLRSENDLVYDYFKDDYEPAYGWSPRARQVEIRHLLSMMSGYDCADLVSNFACEDAMYETGDWVQYSLDLPFSHDPGRHWAYNSSSLILVGEALARGSGMTVEEFAEHYLFGPLGIERFLWHRSPKKRAWIGGGARMIPREMAKIGLLMLERGLWKGKRLLSEKWIDKSTTKQGEALTGVDYGYLWQSGEAYVGSEKIRGFWASGNGGQYIIVLPDHDMVVVFTGGNYNSTKADQPFRMMMRSILPSFLNPVPPEKVSLTEDQIQDLAGVYELDFAPAATSTIEVGEGRVALISPDGETIPLVAHSPGLFTGESRYGPIAVEFEKGAGGNPVRHTIYGSFQRFVFERR